MGKYELVPFPLECEEGELQSLDDRPYRRLAAIILGIFVFIFGIWAAFAPLASAVPAVGQVSVPGNRKIIQHFEGGIVSEILVKDGEHVQENQPLIRLDETRFKAELEIVSAQYLESLAKEARLLAERDNLPEIALSEELLQSQDPLTERLIVAQQSEFNARRKLLEDDEIVSKQRIEQLRNQSSGIEAIVISKQDLLNSYIEEISEWENLYEQQLIDKLRLRDVVREKTRSEGEIASQKAEIAKIGVQVSEIEAQMIVKRQEFLRSVLAELSETQRRLAELKARKITLQDSLDRSEIRSPVAGIVVNLQVHTIGAVVGSGRPILDIVPDGEMLIIDGRVATHEVNYIHEGMSADIHFAGFAHVRSLKVVKGTLYEVSADSLVDERTQVPYYAVKIRVTKEGEAELKRNHLEIKPGMPADAMIVTGERTLLEYITQPFRNMFIRGFREQ
ncbi:hypothetical protein CCZ01_02820 [Helicobacter monodelphidis]|uniref:HlyD family type I secretion periplasmic adaptor subunit n=1 Tax=Helicobacter sp. 15-1451 TaxID=2004995 RepID=UPI000DCD7751|nr:HlyD family type I secretion periplasmic adaptor subunit [Helicobacter sp. 15-1451]RAX58366.1 hypothetical protein CCZ01_02820 [Helicobacter sp. 15-1451]